MSETFTPGPTPNTVRTADGKVLTVPGGWILLPPGDAALTRRAKAAGDHWVVAEKKGRKVLSRGIWTSAASIDCIRAHSRPGLIVAAEWLSPLLCQNAHRMKAACKESRNRCSSGGPGSIS
jgi:hypothetical protein